MVTPDRERLIVRVIMLQCVCLLLLAAFGTFSLEWFYVLAFSGFILIVDTTAPFRLSQMWRKPLYWIILVGTVGFLGLVIRRIYLVLSAIA